MQGKEGPVPFNLQFLPPHYCEGHSNPYDKKIFKAEVTAPLQNSMLDATKFMLFFKLVLWVYLYFHFRTIEVLCGDFKKPAFCFTLW